jgi:hypothetical protein
MSFDFYSLIELQQLKAIALALEPNLDSIYRIKCRNYSQKFQTPLHLVYELDPVQVLRDLFEDQYPPSIVEEELEELMDRLYTMKDPSYSRMSAEETEELVDAVLNREIKRLSKKKPPTQETIKADIKAAEIPKSGGMNFADLEKLEAKAETNKAGFDS